MKNTLTLALLFFSTLAFAQPINDNCWEAIKLDALPKNTCSAPGQYTLEDATSSGYNAPPCWTDNSRDVWFWFVATAAEVRITVNGASGKASGGTLRQPEIALYRGICGGVINLLKCVSDAASNNTVELFAAGLTIGEPYLIRVKGRNDNVGTFQICLINTNPTPLPQSDCSTAVVLCDKSTITVPVVTGGGKNRGEFQSVPCLNEQPGALEKQSTWFRWTVKTSGTLTFTLTPLNPIDDLDFAVFELPGGIDDCRNKQSLRCEFAGESPSRYPSPCHGPTGLSLSAKDTGEPPGCSRGQDNFVKYLDVQAGKSYVLGIDNFSATGQGFILEWGGTATFLGPQADFEVDPPSGLKCEETFKVIDHSRFANGSIVKKTWNFGKDAIPPTAVGNGPFDVNYNTFGKKYLSLTVESDRGCVITKVVEIFVEPCCEDLPGPVVDTSAVQDLHCYGIPEGVIRLGARRGVEPYQYSIDGQEFRPFGIFSRLEAGTYRVYIQDAKGCLYDTTITVDQPPEVIIDAGPDQTILLGLCAEVEATTQNVDVPPNVPAWQGGEPGDIACDDCLSTKLCPKKTTTYTVEIEDENGCRSIDSITIIVQLDRPFYAPNVIIDAEGSLGLNKRFTIFGGPALERIERLEIYSRWGELIWVGTDLEPGNVPQGWDAALHNKKVDPGVFVWKADLRYIDGVVVQHAGSLTVLR